MALPLTETDKFLLLHALGAPESRDRVSALLDLAGTGNMTGPASATDNALVRFDGATGALVQNSSVLLSDAGALSGLVGASFSSGQVLAAFGSVGAPSYSFSGDADTGLFRSLADTIDFVTSGIQRGNVGSNGAWAIGTSGGTETHLLHGSLTISGNNITASNAVTAVNRLLAAVGSAGSPSLSFSADSNTGLYNPTADSIGFSAAGSSIATLNTFGFGVGFTPDVNNMGYYRVDQNATSRVTVRNSNAGASAIARFTVNSTAGDIDLSAPSVAAGATANLNIGSTFTGGFNIDMNGANSMRLQTNSATRLTADGLGNVVMGTAALLTTATDGFFYASASAGSPTGVPTTHAGRVPIHIDESNGRFYAYYGGAWHFVALT